jgi:hypothetical protein
MIQQGMESMGRMDQCDIITMLAGSQCCAPPPLGSFSESERGRAAEVAAWSLDVVGASPPSLHLAFSLIVYGSARDPKVRTSSTSSTWRRLVRPL